MAKTIFLSIFMFFCMVLWTKASYVEAVAGAYDASQSRADLQVAMACGHFNKYLDPTTHQWTDDLTSTCLAEKMDILTYCQKQFPGYDVTNIVEADQAKNITAWCSEEDSSDCTITAMVVPFRCLVGTFESDALVVPNLCRFRHLHEEGSCQTPQQWKKAAKASCRKSKTRLVSTGMLLPCEEQVDLYQGVEFVCCPREGREEPPVIETPVSEAPSQPAPAPPKEVDPYLIDDENRDESTAFEAAKKRLVNRQQERVAMVMQQYQEAQKRLNSSDKNFAKKKKEMTKRYEDAIASLEIETTEKQQHLQEVHERRIEDKLTKKIEAEEKHYWATLEQEPLKSKRILRAFEKYLKAVQKKRQHIISHYKHLRRSDPDRAAKITDDVLTELDESSARVNENVERLQKLPEVYAEIKAGIANLKDTYSDDEDDTNFIQGVQDEAAEIDADNSQEDSDSREELSEDKDVEEPTKNLPQATSIQSKTPGTTKGGKIVTKPTKDAGMKSSSSSEEEDEEEEDIELPTEFRTTLNVPEGETEMAPEIPVIAVKPMESYTDEEKDPIAKVPLSPPLIVAKKGPLKDAHSKTELHVRSKSQAFSVDKTISKKALRSTPALAFALACAILGVFMGLVVAVLVIKKKTRRTPVNQGFTEVDPNLTVEQRHIVSMQQNGYENPTYKYFEMQ